jgi:hypothetical protein
MRPRTATAGPMSARGPPPGVSPLAGLTPLTTPRPLTPGASPSTPEIHDSKFMSDIIRSNQQMKNEIEAYRKMFEQFKVCKTELTEERRARAALELTVTNLQQELGAARRDESAERDAISQATSAHAAMTTMCSTLQAQLDAERQTVAALECENRQLCSQSLNQERALENERISAEGLRTALQAASAALARAGDEQELAQQRSAERLLDIETRYDSSMETSKATIAAVAEREAEISELQRELAEARDIVARVQTRRSNSRQTQTPIVMFCDTAVLTASPPSSGAAGSSSEHPRSASLQSLESVYVDFLDVCDMFNRQVNEPTDREAANQAMQEANRALGTLLGRVDAVEIAANDEAMRILADVLAHAIVTTTTIHAHAAQGVCIEAELGDEAYNDHEMTMLIALRRVVREQLRQQSRRISRSPSVNS